MLAQNTHNGAAPGRVQAVRGYLPGSWWYSLAPAEPIARARCLAAAAAVGQILAGGTAWPGQPAGSGGASWLAQWASPSGAPVRPTGAGVLAAPPGPGGAAGMMTPGRALAALRVALGAGGLRADGMIISRLEGVLTPVSGPPVRYTCGWLMWPARRLSHRGRPLYAVHSASDPAGAGRRLIASLLTPVSPGRPGNVT